MLSGTLHVVSIFSFLLFSDSDVKGLVYKDEGKQLKETVNILENREKRDLGNSEFPEILVNETFSNETSFETYEKEYLINRTMNLLKQFLHYDHYLKHLKEENSSIRRGTSTSKPAMSSDPIVPTPLPHTGNTTTPNDARMDIRILQQKLSELNSLDVSQLTRVFNNLHRTAEKGVEDPGITSLCCNIG